VIAIEHNDIITDQHSRSGNMTGATDPSIQVPFNGHFVQIVHTLVREGNINVGDYDRGGR